MLPDWIVALCEIIVKRASIERTYICTFDIEIEDFPCPILAKGYCTRTKRQRWSISNKQRILDFVAM